MSDPTGPLTIVSLTAENVKRIRAVQITPDGHTVVLSGKNAQGKSSVIDAIWLALGGSSAGKANPRPVRDGETSANVQVDLGELVVTRTWREDGTSALKVESKDGARFPQPQAMLDRLVGKLSFDPFAFTQLSAKDQRRALLELVTLTDSDGTPIDLDDLRARRADWYAERTEVGRVERRYREQLAAHAPAPEGLPSEPVSLGDLLEEARLAREAQTTVERAAYLLRERQEDVNRYAEQIVQIEKSLTAAKKNLAAAQRSRDAAALAAEKLPEPPDVQEIEDRIGRVEETNTLVRAEQRRQETHDRWSEHVARQEELTQQIADLDETVAVALSKAELPLTGLSIADDAVLYGAVPLQQASSAEQLRVSVAVAMALNPTVRVLSIRDGSLLDSESMATIAELAADQGFQVWVEVVDETGQLGVVIEDGMVAV